MRTIRLAVAVAVLAAVLAVIAAAAETPNLLQNENAEQGPPSAGGNVDIPLWEDGLATQITYGSPGHLNPSDPGPADRGSQFFAGGPTTQDTSISQCIDLASYPGAKLVVVSGWFGGRHTIDDAAQLQTRWHKLSGCAGRSLTSPGPTTRFVRAADRGSKSGLVLRSARGPIPAGVNSIRVIVFFDRTGGSYNNGYADNLSLKLMT
jgi:hypothetical protein